MIKLLTATAAAALLAGAANAAITVTSTAVETFDAPASAGFSFSALTAGTATTSGLFTGSTTGVVAAPTGDTSEYFAALGAGGTNHGVGTLTSTTPISSLSVEIGSLDSFNTVSFFSGGTLVESLTGTEISPTLVDTSTTAYYDFTDTSGTFDSVSFSSDPHNALEIDNIGISAAPEPSTWAVVVLSAFGLCTLNRFRRGAPLPFPR